MLDASLGSEFRDNEQGTPFLFVYAICAEHSLLGIF